MSFKIRNNRVASFAVAAFLAMAPVAAQNAPEWREVLTRLDRLEQENRELMQELVALRKQIAGQNPATTPATNGGAAVEKIGERVAVDETRIDDLAQTRVEASQKLPIRITGMALFNAYVNGQANGNAGNPTTASLTPGQETGGATLRQTTLGLEYSGAQTIFGAAASGSLYMDFFGGSTASLNHLLRLRTAEINLDWTNRSVMVGQEKPLISPREPDSMAQVGVSPLTGAGNLWLWQPQVRFEQRFGLGEDSGLRAQAAVFQTAFLGSPGDYSGYVSTVTGLPAERQRPGLEGRFEFWHRWGEAARIELAPGFHYSRAYVGDDAVPSHVFSTDWLIRPVRRIDFTGAFFQGQNVQGLGGLPQGFTLFYKPYRIVPVRSWGGWSQLQFALTPRLTAHLYGGEEDDRNGDLIAGEIGRNTMYAANTMYRVAPNVILSFEVGQVRTTYLAQGRRLNNHYDVAIGYLF